MTRLQDRVALVTGGASGIGRATVQRFLAEGARVVFADLNPDSSAEALALFRQLGGEARVAFRRADVTDDAVVADLVALALERWGRLDVAFLNAGVGGAFGPIAETTVAEWDATFAFLVRSVFLGIRHAVGPMRAAGGGSIIATASVAGLAGGGGSHAYSAAKAAVVNLVRSAAGELGADRIRVNAVAPGLIATPLVHRGDPARLPDMRRNQPWPDYGQPEDIAAAVAFLASDDARFITGEVLVVDGGLTSQASDIWGPDKPYMRRSGLDRGTTGEAHEMRPRGGG